VDAVGSLGLNVSYIFLSDHGMTTVDNIETLPLPQSIDTNLFIIPSGTSLLHLYAKNKKDIEPTYQALKKEARDYDVYLAADMPPSWHYSSKDDRFNRIGDIILVPHLPKVFNINKRRISIGEHGFDPALTEMHATFYAWGPAFKQHQAIAGFENINVYPLIAKILDLHLTEKIDGNLNVLSPILAH
jgi:predicted AlkP superfamily pyrophosphatase or phosphodiesterase